MSARAHAPPDRTVQRLRRGADAARAGIVCAAAVFLLVGDGSAALKALLVLPPACAGRVVRAAPAFDLLFVVALLAEVVATALGAYDTISWGDGLSHVVLPLLSGPILYAGIVRVRGAVDSARASALVTVAAVLSLGLAWELVEWLADAALGTDFSQGYDDTLDDLRNNAIAAVGSGALVAAALRWGERRWISP